MVSEDLKIPVHIGIIVDGNGRWAKEQGLSRSMGHKAGADNIEKIASYAFEKGVKVLSLYVFSTENFKRSEEEVNYLMDLFAIKFKNYSTLYNKQNIKVVFSGRKKPLPEKVLKMMEEMTEKTKDNTGGIINFCLNYGGQAEIVDAVKRIVKEGVDVDTLDIESFSKYLYQDLPPVDLMIRTSGEQRLSNFLLWQCSYAEFYFPETYFPAFTKDDFDLAILKYNNRDRRFGGIKYEDKTN